MLEWLQLTSEHLSQAFLFDLFLASRPSGFAKTLSFLLESLSFFPLSFEGMFERLQKLNIFALKLYPFLNVLNVSSLILEF